MNKWPEFAMSFAAILLACLFLPGLSGTELLGVLRRIPEVHSSPRYHGGKTPAVPGLDPSCQSGKCHVAFPHKKNRMLAAFRNMHQDFADCLSCHGREPGKHWELKSRKEGKGWKISCPAPAAQGNPHAALGDDLSCRKCHSDSGRDMMQALNVPGLSRGFADPIALRMIEGGSRRWVPADLR